MLLLDLPDELFLHILLQSARTSAALIRNWKRVCRGSNARSNDASLLAIRLRGFQPEWWLNPALRKMNTYPGSYTGELHFACSPLHALAYMHAADGVLCVSDSKYTVCNGTYVGIGFAPFHYHRTLEWPSAEPDSSTTNNTPHDVSNCKMVWRHKDNPTVYIQWYGGHDEWVLYIGTECYYTACPPEEYFWEELERQDENEETRRVAANVRGLQKEYEEKAHGPSVSPEWIDQSESLGGKVLEGDSGLRVKHVKSML